MNMIITFKLPPMLGNGRYVQHGYMICDSLSDDINSEGEVMEYVITYEKYKRLQTIKISERTYNDIIS